MIRTLKADVAAIDPLLALDEVQTMSEAISSIEAPRRFNTALITAFALAALALAITGIYAVVASPSRSAPRKSPCAWPWARNAPASSASSSSPERA